MSLTQLAQSEICQELIKENFPAELIDNTLQLIILYIEEYREEKSVFYRHEIPGVVKRLVEEYSKDKYQVKEMVV